MAKCDDVFSGTLRVNENELPVDFSVRDYYE